MPSPDPTNNKNSQTKKIEISNLDQKPSPEDFIFNLGPKPVSAPSTAKESPRPAGPDNPDKNVEKRIATLHPLFRQAWYFIEWIVVSLAIFAVLFFAINFQSYSILIRSKFDQFIGQTPALPAGMDALPIIAPEDQEPLPLPQNIESAKKQIPDFNIPITPPDYRIIIPRIGQNVPVVKIPVDKLLQKDYAALEKQIQDALKNGVLHFPGTAQPGENGNVVITGHSSYFPWDPGRFKDVFALLHQVSVGDEIIIYRDQKAYYYTVYDKLVVKPSQVEVLAQEGENKITLITCTPIGTALNRLIIVARPKI